MYWLPKASTKLLLYWVVATPVVQRSFTFTYYSYNRDSHDTVQTETDARDERDVSSTAEHAESDTNPMWASRGLYCVSLVLWVGEVTPEVWMAMRWGLGAGVWSWYNGIYCFNYNKYLIKYLN